MPGLIAPLAVGEFARALTVAFVVAAQQLNQVRVVGDERDLVIQAEGAHVHVGRADRAQAAVDDHILGVQHSRLAVQVDAHARPEECPVVGTLCVADQELVELLGKKELDLDAG